MRRHIGAGIFVTVWFVVAAVRPLRLMQCGMVFGGEWMMPPALLPENRRPKPCSMERLARLHPDNIAAQAKAAERSREGERHFRGIVERYDRLSQRFPDQPWIVANRLRYTCPWLVANRVAGDLDQYAEPSGEKYFTSEELSDAIAAARRGQQLEPDNTFFDWMLAYFLFAGNGDEEALAVLHSAAQSPRYDAHLREDVRASIAAHELQHSLLFEQRAALWAAILFPHLLRLREAAKLAVWEGVKTESAGDHRRALQIYADVVTLASTMRQGSYGVIEALVADSIERTAWSGTTRRLSHAERQDMQKKLESVGMMSYYPYEEPVAGKFADYAVAHGRGDLAEETRREAKRAAEGRRQLIAAWNSRDFYCGNRRGTIVTIRGLWCTCFVLLAQVMATASLWLLLSVASKAARVQRRPVPAHDLIRYLFVSGCIQAALMGWSIWLGADWRNWMPESDCLPDYPVDFTTSLWLLVAATPMLVGLLCCVWSMVRRPRAVSEGPDASVASASDGQPLTPTTDRRLVSLLAKAACWVLSCCSLLSWVALFLPTYGMPRSFLVWSLPPATSFLSAIAWTAALIWFTPPEKQSVAHYAVRWYQRFLATSAVLASILYLVLSAASLPSRCVADRQVGSLIERGETAMIRERFAAASGHGTTTETDWR